jgi:hypothetical protein
MQAREYVVHDHLESMLTLLLEEEGAVVREGQAERSLKNSPHNFVSEHMSALGRKYRRDECKDSMKHNLI